MMDNITCVLYGQTFTVVDFSFFNQYIPIFQSWSQGIFWLYYGFYVFDSVYFLIRGTHALKNSIAWSDIKVSNTEGGKK